MSFPMLGPVLCRSRNELGWSLQKLADRVGITKAHLWELEKGHTQNPTLAVIVGLARALGMSPAELVALLTDTAA
jgi:transcriptional regulator with XRE-family HTH domain